MREALRALELVVVIDIAMTETARAAIAYSQHRLSLVEATFFSFEFPELLPLEKTAVRTFG